MKNPFRYRPLTRKRLAVLMLNRSFLAVSIWYLIEATKPGSPVENVAITVGNAARMLL